MGCAACLIVQRFRRNRAAAPKARSRGLGTSPTSKRMRISASAGIRILSFFGRVRHKKHRLPVLSRISETILIMKEYSEFLQKCLIPIRFHNIIRGKHSVDHKGLNLEGTRRTNNSGSYIFRYNHYSHQRQAKELIAAEIVVGNTYLKTIKQQEQQ